MPRYLLDTNAFRALLSPNSPLDSWLERNPGEVLLSAVAVREILRGALASIAEAEGRTQGGKSSLADRYALLLALLFEIGRHPILPYSDSAEALFQSWPSRLHRVGTSDCRIAASAIVGGCIVLTRNTVDFARIAEGDPRLRFSDWLSD